MTSEEQSPTPSSHDTKKTIANIVAWTLFGSGSIAIALSLSGFPIKEKSLALYDDLLVEKETYTSIIKDEAKTKKKNVQEILSDLGEGYSPNLLLNLTEDELGEAEDTENTIIEETTAVPPKPIAEPSLSIPVPPTASSVLDKVNELKFGNSPAATDESTTTTSTIEEAITETTVEEIVKAPIRPNEPKIQEAPKTAFIVAAETKAPIRPAAEPEQPLEIPTPAKKESVDFEEDSKVFDEEEITLEDTVNTATTTVVEETTTDNQSITTPLPQQETVELASVSAPIPQSQSLQLEDLLYGLNWNSKKVDINNRIEECISITDSIEGCRLNYRSWLPNTRHVVGLFDTKNDGTLMALQIDSYPFENNLNLIDSFETTSRIVNEKLVTEDISIREQMVSDPTNILLTLATDKAQRHYRHWSLSDIQIPAYIHASIKALNETTGFHRTLFIETELAD